MSRSGEYGQYKVEHKSYRSMVRFTPRGKRELNMLAEHYDCSEAEIIRRAVNEMATRLKVERLMMEYE